MRSTYLVQYRGCIDIPSTQSNLCQRATGHRCQILCLSPFRRTTRDRLQYESSWMAGLGLPDLHSTSMVSRSWHWGQNICRFEENGPESPGRIWPKGWREYRAIVTIALHLHGNPTRRAYLLRSLASSEERHMRSEPWRFCDDVYKTDARV